MKNLKMGNITPKWVKVISSFSDNYSAMLTASEISKEIKMPQQTVSRILNNLVKFNLISYIKKGRNKMFHLDLGKQKTRMILDIVENQKSLEFYLKNRKIAIILNELMNCCDGIIVFGSYASESSHANSDLDLVLFGADKKAVGKIKQKSVMEINEHYAGYKEFRKILKSKNPLSVEILNNHILFGDVSQIAKIFWEVNNE